MNDILLNTTLIASEAVYLAFCVMAIAKMLKITTDIVREK